MDPVSLIAGVAVGAAVGFGAALGGSKKKSAELSERVKELEDAKSKAQKQLESGQSELKKAKDAAADLEKKLKKEKKAAKELEGAAKSNKQALDKAQKQAKKATTEAEQKAKEAAKLKKDLDAAGITNAAKYDKVKGDLNGILKVLCEHEKQQAAVVADANGIVVAAHGSQEVRESVAAAATRITKIGTDLSSIVDFGQVATFRLADSGKTVIAGRAVDIHGETVALATMGAKIPSDKSLDGAIENLSAALS